MTTAAIQPDGLVIYKKRPARVLRVSDKVEIELQDGNRARVRVKDLILLHPGPLRGFDELQPVQANVEMAWEILCDEGDALHALSDIAELIYGEYTPSTAWQTWQWLDDGLYFHGTPDAISICSINEVNSEKLARKERKAQSDAWLEFIERARRNEIDPQVDRRFLGEVEDYALGRIKQCRLLKELGRAERPENAHALLLTCGYWDYTVTPYLSRLSLSRNFPDYAVPALQDEDRLDLTHLDSFAIDDVDNQDPDDAISLEECIIDSEGHFMEGRLWVHVADVSALVLPDSPADIEARGRGETLYLADGNVPMLPRTFIDVLGMGLQDRNPALSFGLSVDASGEISDIEITPSWVKVQRLSYESAERLLDSDPFRSLSLVSSAYCDRRQGNGATLIDLPEVIVRVMEDKVFLRTLERLRSRDIVREAMLMVGEAAARFAVQNGIASPFVTQEPPEFGAKPRDGLVDPRAILAGEIPPSLAGDYAIRRSLKRSQISVYPNPHIGIGLPYYTRATSPLRRYLDLLVHQQIRGYMRGDEILSQVELIQRIGETGPVVGSVNLAESLIRRHWTLVYLMQNPQWHGNGVIVEKHGMRSRVIIPELALEVPVHLQKDMHLDSQVQLRIKEVNLPDLEAYFVQGQ